MNHIVQIIYLKRNYYRIVVREHEDNISVTQTYMEEYYQNESGGNILCWEWTELAQYNFEHSNTFFYFTIAITA